MENYKLIIYILIGVIYFIFKNRKKQPQPVRPAPVRTQDTFSEAKRFDEHNKEDEISGKRNKPFERFKTEDASEVNRSTQPVNYDDLLAEKEEKLTESKGMNDLDRESKEMFVPYLNKGGENEYGKLLKRPESLKQAIILNEIMTPKHF